ncbi:MAG: hypothetical protein QXT02_01205 [Candidatus Hadarchaeum sp.]|uniref:hypothetical protein n=2 Tax=Candidatus Hadarchaeum sp. TaxID=2883567 RepID=UPI00316D5455
MTMKTDYGQKGVALSSLALLLMLPALLLAASSLKIIEIGGETNSIQILADKVYYTGKEISETIKLMQKNRVPINDISLQVLAEKYRAATGLIICITSNQVYPLWIHVQPTGVNHYAGSKYCVVEKISANRWKYSFEDSDANAGETVDFDYNEPELLIEKIDENLKITVLAYNSPHFSDVYYSKELLWSEVGGIGERHVGESTEIEENCFGSFILISIEIRDPNDLVRCFENVLLT